ncbi:hypothetical protein Cgig2_013928 [Carnegiea gigantea]|uniref:Uncharacterized protein n=1 Tax=Carnegiea gigantea TaxID=171969 RepID=A0A9Q1K2U0_9CARY|nr:hypothetical protein Cgig2_013928 [Carnegiea gigantea]
MQLGAEIIDNDVDRDLVMNKMARTLRQGTLWTKNRDGKGIIKALRIAMPTASRRTCVIHYNKNFASLYPGAWFHAFFYIAANLRNTEKIELWARFKFDTNLKCDDNTNNFVKSFNHAIIKFRGLPILTMVEEIRKLTGSRFMKRFKKLQKWNGRLVPFVHKKLLITEMESRNCTHLSQQLPHKVLGSGTTKCKTCKHLGYNATTCGRPRDEHGRLLTKRKRRPIEGRVPKPRGRPKKQKAATLTPTPSIIAAAQAGPSTQCSQVGASQAT